MASEVREKGNLNTVLDTLEYRGLGGGGERLRWPSGKESACQCRRCRFYPWLGKIPCRGKWQPAPVFLPGKSHGQRSLAGYSPWGHKESDMTEHAQGFFCLFVFYILDRQIVYFQVISHSELFGSNVSGCWSLWNFNLLPSSLGLSPELRNAMLAASLSVTSLGAALLWLAAPPSFLLLVWNASFFRTSDAVKQVTWSCAFSNSRFQQLQMGTQGKGLIRWIWWTNCLVSRLVFHGSRFVSICKESANYYPIIFYTVLNYQCNCHQCFWMCWWPISYSFVLINVNYEESTGVNEL